MYVKYYVTLDKSRRSAICCGSNSDTESQGTLILTYIFINAFQSMKTVFDI